MEQAARGIGSAWHIVSKELPAMTLQVPLSDVAKFIDEVKLNEFYIRHTQHEIKFRR